MRDWSLNVVGFLYLNNSNNTSVDKKKYALIFEQLTNVTADCN